MRAYSAILFIVCINIAAWIISVSGVFPSGGVLWLSPTDVIAQFGLNVFGSIVIDGAITGLIAFLLRQQINASYAPVIWLIGIVFSFGTWFIGGIPIMLARILPAELWYISVALQALFGVIFFVFLVEVMGSRQIT